MKQKKRLKNKPIGSYKQNTLRIIAGKWRSRKLPLIDAPGMRPTPDRIRETLFNWLQTDVHGARCLDLFAGSGALGLEALSRSAQQVVFVEKNKTVAKQLENNLQQLQSSEKVIQMDALAFLQSLPEATPTFDLIFLDPPYRKNLLDASLKMLTEKGLIQKNTLIYVEHESEEIFEGSDYELKVYKTTKAGQVSCSLCGLH